MKVTVCEKEYTLEQKVSTILDLLSSIKSNQNSSLAFRSGCRSGVCGSCAVTVNGVETLSCKTKPNDKDIISPLKNLPVIKDLIIDLENQNHLLSQTHAYLENRSDKTATSSDEKIIDTESNCLLCSSCFSSCPVFELNPNFIGPYALTRVYRYTQDVKESSIENKIASVQENGIWDCTLCGNCDMVCPSHIGIKNAITQLRNKSAVLGYNNPYMQNFDSGFDSNLDFGFNPNGF